MRGLFAFVMVALVGAVGCAGEPQACTEMGCVDQLRIRPVDQNGALLVKVE